MNRRTGQKWMVIAMVCWLYSTMIFTCSDLFAQTAGSGGGGTSFSEAMQANSVIRSPGNFNPYSGSSMMGAGPANPKPNTWNLDDQSTVTVDRVFSFIYANGQLALEHTGGANSQTVLSNGLPSGGANRSNAFRSSPIDDPFGDPKSVRSPFGEPSNDERPGGVGYAGGPVDPFKPSKPAGEVSSMTRATGLRITALLLPSPEAKIAPPSAESGSKPNKSLIIGIDLGANIRWDGSGRTLFYEPRNVTPNSGGGSINIEGGPYGAPMGSESEKPHFLFRLTTELPRLADENLRNQPPIRDLYALSTDERLAIVQSISSGIEVETLRIVFSRWMARGENAKQFEDMLRKAMSDQYDANLKLQEIQVKKVEDRVKLLRDELAKRTTARDRIVGLMMEQISLRAQGLQVDVGVLGFPGLRNESGQGASQVPAGGSNPFPPGNNNPFGPSNQGLADPFK